MNTRDELLALADRCERAKNDQAIDRTMLLEIFRAARPRTAFATGRDCDVARGHFIQLWEAEAPIDAAMALTEGLPWPYNVTMATAYGSASVMPVDVKSTGIHDKRGGHCRGAATPGLALLAAALRSRAGAAV